MKLDVLYRAVVVIIIFADAYSLDYFNLRIIRIRSVRQGISGIRTCSYTFDASQDGLARSLEEDPTIHVIASVGTIPPTRLGSHGRRPLEPRFPLIEKLLDADMAIREFLI